MTPAPARPTGVGPRASALLLAVILPMALAACSPHPSASNPAVPALNPIAAENRESGTDAWRVSKYSDDVDQQVKGYASAVSVNVGESITFFVTVNPAQFYSIDVYRFGYYSGQGGRLMKHVNRISGLAQPACPLDTTTGMVSCHWSPSYALAVPPTWTSGVYLAKLTNEHGFQNYITFVVRDDSRASALLYQQSVTTYQAYNNYPHDAPGASAVPATGKSLYDFNSSRLQTSLRIWRSTKVSFDRPYSDNIGRGDGSGNFTQWESYYVRWLEMNDYDVTYTTDVDVHRDGVRLLGHRGFLSVGHDEYWSAAMYQAVEKARDRGVGLGFFGANAVYWQIRFESSSDGRPNRVQVCYKDAALDPVKNATSTVLWRDAPANRPEQQLVGIMSSGQQTSGAPPAMFVAANTSNWLYNGTGVTEGQAIASVVGYETDRYHSNYPPPITTAGTYVTLSRSPYMNTDAVQDYQESSIYQAPSGAWVFAAGSIEWSWGLYNDDEMRVADARIQVLTARALLLITTGGDPQRATPVAEAPLGS
jgi:hypothetical protein